MSVISYEGNIQPAITLGYTSDKVAGAHASADENYLFLLANESTTDITIQITTPTEVFELRRNATAGRRLFSDELNTYVVEPVSSITLNTILGAVDSENGLSVSISLKTKYDKFMLEMIKQLSRTGSDFKNLADPEDPSTVLESFNYSYNGNSGSVTHIEEERDLVNLPGTLYYYEVDSSSTAGDPPVVKLFFELNLKDTLSFEEHREVTDILIASDYSKVHMYSKPWKGRANPWFGNESEYSRSFPNPLEPEPTTIERCLKDWELNIMNYLWNHTDLLRAGRFLDDIIAGDVLLKEESRADIVEWIRNKIDEKLITANHWGEDREMWDTERYQRKLSDLFGAIQQNHWYASPVSFYRDLENLHDLTPTQAVGLILHYGVGHCGEHALVSFVIIYELMNKGFNDIFKSVIYTGNSNSDHAFVVGGLELKEVINTNARYSHTPGGVGAEKRVWDLRQTLEENPGEVGFVLDPYLDHSAIAATADGLLRSISSESRGDRRTDFLLYLSYYTTIFDPPSESTRDRVMGV